MPGRKLPTIRARENLAENLPLVSYIDFDSLDGLNDLEKDDYDGLGVEEETCNGLNDAEMGDSDGFGNGLGAVTYTEYNGLDLGLNEPNPNPEDFELLKDVQLCPGDSNDEEEGRYDSEVENSPQDIHRNLVVKEFKFQPNRSIKLAKGHEFQTFNYFRQVLVNFCVQEGVNIKKVKNYVGIQIVNGGCMYHMLVSWIVLWLRHTILFIHVEEQIGVLMQQLFGLQGFMVLWFEPIQT